MSIIQGLLATLGSTPPPSYYLNTSGTYGEGYAIDLYINYEYADGRTVYWTIVADSATQGTDYTTTSGNYSGSYSPTGSGNYTVATVNFAADSTTEGTEYFIIKLGSSPGGNDLTYNSVNINDLSVAPPRPTTDYTIEWWQKMPASQPSNYPRLFNVGAYSSETPGISFEPNGTRIWSGPGAIVDVVNRSFNNYDTWQHFAIVRNSGTMAFYIDGTNRISTNNGGSAYLNNKTSPFTLGWGSSQQWNGKIASFHWIKGTAKYTSNFTPLKRPAPLLTNSKYLLNVVDDSNKLVDTAGLHYIQSQAGTVSFDTDTPWYTTASAVTHDSNSWGQGGNGIYGIQFDSSYTDLENVKSGWTITNGGWSDVVAADVALAQGTYSVVLAGNVQPPNGTYTFTPPTQTGSLVFNSSYITVAASPDWAIDVGQNLGFNGTDGSYVQATGNTSDWNLGDTYTIEWWEKLPNATPSNKYRSMFCQQANNNAIDVMHNNGQISLFNGELRFNEPASAGRWNHVAVQKDGTTVKAYINGVETSIAYNTASTLSNSSLNLAIGSRTSDGGSQFYGQYFEGQISNIKISTIARYSGTFTPSRFMTVDGNTKLALNGSPNGAGMLYDATGRHTVTNYGATIGNDYTS